jgi:phosphoadenosine phosphosulfate reductase
MPPSPRPDPAAAATAARPPSADLGARATLEEVVERFHPRLALACSFQKEEAVLLDLLLEIAPDARVFALDTGVLFEETYAVWRQVEARYGIEIAPYRGEWVDGLWARDPERCCFLRKVEPLGRALEDLDCWITGVRREQSPTRASAGELEWDAAHGLWKANPLASWTDKDVWRTIHARDLPYHPLHDAGYASIGCTHCTLPGAGREGRWAGLQKTECGLHVTAGGETPAANPVHG